jgi:hypothetical protein
MRCDAMRMRIRWLVLEHWSPTRGAASSLLLVGETAVEIHASQQYWKGKEQVRPVGLADAL